MSDTPTSSAKSASPNPPLASRHPGRPAHAHIVAVKLFRLVVRLDGLGVTGTVATEALGPGPWELDKATYSLVSKRHSYMVGEAVRVRVASTDEALGRLEFELRPSR